MFRRDEMLKILWIFDKIGSNEVIKTLLENVLQYSDRLIYLIEKQYACSLEKMIKVAIETLGERLRLPTSEILAQTVDFLI